MERDLDKMVDKMKIIDELYQNFKDEKNQKALQLESFAISKKKNQEIFIKIYRAKNNQWEVSITLLSSHQCPIYIYVFLTRKKLKANAQNSSFRQ